MNHSPSPTAARPALPLSALAAAVATPLKAAAAATPHPAARPDRAVLIQAIEAQNRQDHAAAEPLLAAYLQSAPDDAAALYSLAITYNRTGRDAQALALLEHAAIVAPGFAPTWGLRGSLLQAAERFDDALASYDRALALNPDYVEILVNSGVLLRKLLRHHEALVRFNRVLQVKPDHEAALGNCAILLTEFKKSAEAIAMFQRLLAVRPDYEDGLGLLCYERLHACDWTDFEPTVAAIVQGLMQGRRTCKSLPLMAMVDDPAAHQAAARLFAQRHFPPSPRPLWQGAVRRHDRVRLAYLSPDLREHPVGHLMCGIFEQHDKRRFETIAVSLGADDGSRLRQRMVAAFDHFLDVRLVGARRIAEQLQAMEVDIIVDLGGYTSDTRTEVLAHRPAPIQVNYLGYPGTMGAPYVDYLIADQHVVPPRLVQQFDEKVVYLPDAYLPTDGGLQIAERTPSRAECGLPDEAFVFCSFNHDYKIGPAVFAVWMGLLRDVPGSVLWLMSRNETARANLQAHAAAAGIDPARLIFAGRVPRVEDHLARYRQADLFLDTHPYNAHTTAADALMAGLPVVTCMGQAFPSRVAGSLLHAVGLPETITHSLRDYAALALALATDRPRLAALRQRLAAQRAQAPLFDTGRICADLETLYLAMWRHHRLGGAADALSPLSANPEPCR